LKAFLLAAGNGTRLRPLTERTPKCLLPVRGTPLLEIWLRICRRFGIDEVLVNVHHHAEMVRSFIHSHSIGPKVHVVEERELLGSAGTLLANREWVSSESMFWVFYADVLHQADLGAMRKMHEARSPAATLGVYRVPDPSRCGVVTVNKEGIIVEFVEKPACPTSDLAFSGLLIGTGALLDAIPAKHPVDIGFDVLPQLTRRLLAYEISDYLTDIGTKENYEKAQITWPALQA
jgi:mannose-1-phosphate guanylyltransferase